MVKYKKIVLLVFLTTGLILAVLMAQQPQRIQKHASTGNGPAILALEPENSLITSRQLKEIKVLVNTNSIPTTGVQFKLQVDGTTGVNFKADLVTNLKVSIAEFSNNTITYLAAISDLQQAFTTSQATQIATITLTPTTNVDLVFDQSFTKILSYETGNELLLSLARGHYALAQSTSPSPSLSPSVIPSPRPSPSSSSSPLPSLNPSVSLSPLTIPVIPNLPSRQNLIIQASPSPDSSPAKEEFVPTLVEETPTFFQYLVGVFKQFWCSLSKKCSYQLM